MDPRFYILNHSQLFYDPGNLSIFVRIAVYHTAGTIVVRSQCDFHVDRCDYTRAVYLRSSPNLQPQFKDEHIKSAYMDSRTPRPQSIR